MYMLCYTYINTVLDDSYRAWGTRVFSRDGFEKFYTRVTPRDEQDGEEKRLFTSII